MRSLRTFHLDDALDSVDPLLSFNRINIADFVHDPRRNCRVAASSQRASGGTLAR